MSKSIFSEQQAALQELLRQARTDAGMTQVELADKLSRPQSFVSKIESGERLLDIVELKEICDALDLTLTDFASRFEEKVS